MAQLGGVIGNVEVVWTEQHGRLFVFKRELAGRVVRCHAPAYMEFVGEHGRLVADRACQALWHFHGVAKSALGVGKNNVEIEKVSSLHGGAVNKQQVDLKRLHAGVAAQYAVSEDMMKLYWPNVKAQCLKLGLLLLEPKYRIGDVS